MLIGIVRRLRVNVVLQILSLDKKNVPFLRFRQLENKIKLTKDPIT